MNMDEIFPDHFEEVLDMAISGTDLKLRPVQEAITIVSQLTNEEYQVLRSQFVTSSSEHGGRRYLPYTFTEQGVSMLSAVLKSETAIETTNHFRDVTKMLRIGVGAENCTRSKEDLKKLEHRMKSADKKMTEGSEMPERQESGE